MVHREDSYGAETLCLPEGTPEGQYLVTVELLPFEQPDLKEKEVKEGEKKEQKKEKKEKGSEVRPKSDSMPVNEKQKGDEETKKSNGEIKNEKGSSNEKVEVREDESKTEGTDLGRHLTIATATSVRT